MRALVLIGSGVLVVGAVLGLGWILTANNIALTGYSQPKYESIRRQTFEQSRAFNEGMAQNLHGMQVSYIQADDEHKAALRAVILHEVADFNEENLPADLQKFLRDLRAGH